MARNNIQFKGIRHSPSDITGQDGDLLECVNLVHEAGELKPIEMPEKYMVDNTAVTSGSADFVLMAVHNLTDGDRFVYVKYNSTSGASTISIKDNTNTATNIVIGSTTEQTHDILGQKILWVDTIGNTIVFGTDKSTHYALYKSSEYKWLGDKLPQPLFEFDFRRNGERTSYDAADYDGYSISEADPKMYTLTEGGDDVPGGGIAIRVNPDTQGNDVFYTYPSTVTSSIQLSNTSEENKIIFRDAIRSRVAKTIGVCNTGNVFVFPFFVRYALRMYDGSYAMHSAPILMIPSSLTCPLLSVLTFLTEIKNGTGGGEGVYVRNDSEGKKFAIANDSMIFRAMELVYRFAGFKDVDGGSFQNIGDWEDIIDGVDIFISSQIYTYDERAWDNTKNIPISFKAFNDSNSNKEYGHFYSQNKKIDWWDVYSYDTGVDPIIDENYHFNLILYDGATSSKQTLDDAYYHYKIPLPSRSASDIMEDIKSVDKFYKVKSYKMTDLSSEWGSPKRFRGQVETGTLERLETLPILQDDYVSRNRIVASANYVYNQRIILGNLSLEAPKWYEDAKKWSDDNTPVSMVFEIEKPEKTIHIEYSCTSGTDLLGENSFGHYIYYPDKDCKRVYVSLYNEATRKFMVPMTEHTGLNGAYALMPSMQSLWESYASFSSYSNAPAPSEDRYYSIRNTIAMSKAANPFHFAASNFIDIGRGKVIGIAANVLDVSYNQWGPYPLYAFCSDGIVAIAIKEDGSFGGIDAVSSDILIEPRSQSQPTLIQANRMLVFLTNRGVMGIAGTNPQLMSAVMNGKNFNPLTELLPTSPTASVLYGTGAFSSLITKTSDAYDFKTFAVGGYLAYDYAHNRVLFLNPSYDYQYVLSLDTMLWSKQIPYTNGSSSQIVVNRDGTPSSPTTLEVSHMQAAVNNYTEMYLQDNTGTIYKTMGVSSENVLGSLYRYGYFISRPVRFGTDEYKTITRMLHRYTHYASNSFAKVAIYGSRNGVSYGRLTSLRGMSYKYFIFVVYTYLKPNERYSYMSVDFEPRLTNKLR